MARTRPGIDRITKQQLTARRKHLDEQISKHDKVCVRCKNAVNLRMRCVDWWRMAVEQHEVRRQLRPYNTQEFGGTAIMFDISE